MGFRIGQGAIEHEQAVAHALCKYRWVFMHDAGKIQQLLAMEGFAGAITQYGVRHCRQAVVRPVALVLQPLLIAL